MDQERLFRLGVEAVSIQLIWVHRCGWRLHVASRRSCEEWSEGDRTTFDHLTHEEMLSALEAHLGALLGT